MIYDASTFGPESEFHTDVCVIGSGAGGAMAAKVLAEAGREVLVLEAGGFVPPSEMNQREEEMFPQLLWANGGQTTGDRGVKIHQGRSLGGSTVHNINLCKRIPDEVRAEWIRDRGLQHLPPQRWDDLYQRVERMMGVSQVDPGRMNRHNRLLQNATQTLGWKGGGLSHNRTGCVGSGFCEIGCVYDAKNNAAKVLIPPAVRAGAKFFTRCQAVRLSQQGDRATGVFAVALDPATQQPVGTVRIHAKVVVVAASATGTPAILLRSGVGDPSRTTGRTLRVHPAFVAAGDFAEPVNAWQGIPQTYECTEFLDFSREGLGTRTWIIPAFAHPVGTGSLLPGIGQAHRTLMSRYNHLAVLTGMIHDTTAGRVRPRGDLGVRIDYWPNAQDRAELLFGLRACVEALLAAGAERAVVPTDPVMTFRQGDDLDALLTLDLWPGRLDITAVHPMGSVAMADNPAHGAVGSDGKHHTVEGLWVADASLFPTSIGVPPQLSVYAMGLHVGEAIAAS